MLRDGVCQTSLVRRLDILVHMLKCVFCQHIFGYKMGLNDVQYSNALNSRGMTCLDSHER